MEPWGLKPEIDIWHKGDPQNRGPQVVCAAAPVMSPDPQGRSPPYRLALLPRWCLNGAEGKTLRLTHLLLDPVSSKNAQRCSIPARLPAVRPSTSLCFCWPPLRITQDEVFSNLLACPKPLWAGGTSVILKCHIFWPGKGLSQSVCVCLCGRRLMGCQN